MFREMRSIAMNTDANPAARLARLSHASAGLALYHHLNPSETVAAVLRDFLAWTWRQEVLLVYGTFLQGQFLRSVVLALDAVGESLPSGQPGAILDHLIRKTVEDPDPRAFVNHHPAGHVPMRRALEMPGCGFHLADEEVNNWDILGAMGLLHVARAADAWLPRRAHEVADWVAVARRRMERFLALQYAPEGEYGEGPSYYSYGTAGALNTLDLLQSWRRGTWWKQLPLDGLLASARWSREMRPREVVHGPFNFNDCGRDSHEWPSVLYWLADRTGDSVAQQYADELMELAVQRAENQCRDGGGLPETSVDDLVRALLCRNADLPSKSPDGAGTRHFGRFGTVISRNSYTGDDVCLCFRCGASAGAHSHADRGHFLLTAFGENVVSEGGKPHDRSIPEYRTYHRETLAHNVALPTGRTQARHADGRACHGRITGFEALANGVFVRADLSEVYPGAGRVERTLRFSHRGWLLVRDSMENPGASIDFLLHTDHRDRRATIEIEPGRAIVRRPGATLLVFPLLAAELMDDGTHFQDSDREGLRSLIVRRAGKEMATLLVVVRAGREDRVRLEERGPREWMLTLEDESIRLAPDESA